MKNRILYITLLLAALLTVCACHNTKIDDTMSNEDILKVLDIKIHRHPKDDALLYQRAQIYMEMHRTNEAISDLTRAISINPKEFDYHMLLGDAYLANGDPDHSYGSLENALALKPNSLEAQLKLGEIAYISKDFDRAMDHLGKVTAKDPNNRTALYMKASIYKETQDTSNAIILFRKVADLYPDFAPVFEELGILYAFHHDPIAFEYLNTAMRLDPNNTNILYNAANIYQEDFNQVDKAEELYKQLLDIDANNKYAWHNRGYIQAFTYGDYPLAVDYFTKAIQCDSSYIEAWTNRGNAYYLMGDRKHAAEDFRAAIDLDHTFQPAIDGMNRIN